MTTDTDIETLRSKLGRLREEREKPQSQADLQLALARAESKKCHWCSGDHPLAVRVYKDSAAVLADEVRLLTAKLDAIREHVEELNPLISAASLARKVRLALGPSK